MNYVAALDGLRAIAILGVLVFHIFPGSLEGGFTGVDVFFVLSGYLITSVILHDLRSGKFSLQEFYLRRIQRLLPNAVLTVITTVAVSFFLLLPSQATKTATHGLWALFNVSNVYIWRSIGGYWADSAASMPFLHTWSLAVEEQFYMLFPTLLLLLFGRIGIAPFVALLTFASFSLCYYGSSRFPNATFYMLPTRAWEPLLGAWLASFAVSGRCPQWLSRKIANCTGWIGLGVIVAGYFVIDHSYVFPGAVALVPALGAFLVLLAVVDESSTVARVLANPALVLIGKLSYSLYLWHWPFTVMGRELAFYLGASTQLGSIIGASIGILLAVLAYRFVEQPFRQRDAARGRRLRKLAIGFAVCALASFGLTFQHRRAETLKYFDRPAFFGFQYSVNASSLPDPSTVAKYADVEFPLADRPTPAEAWKKGGIVHQWGGVTPRVVVLGSSHALMYGRLIDSICKELGLTVAFLSAEGLSVFFPTVTYTRTPVPDAFDDARIKWIAEWRPDVVIAIDKWDLYQRDKGAELDRNLQRLFQHLAVNAKNIILFSQIPALRLGDSLNLREYVAWYLRTFGRLPKIQPDSYEAFRRTLTPRFDNAASQFRNIQLLRVDQPFYLPDGSVRFAEGRKFYYADDDHLTDAGTELLRDLCRQAITVAIGGRVQPLSAGH